jgi:hypothetical protein
MNRVARLMPIVTWSPRYDRTWLPLDVIAGLTVWALSDRCSGGSTGSPGMTVTATADGTPTGLGLRRVWSHRSLA